MRAHPDPPTPTRGALAANTATVVAWCAAFVLLVVESAKVSGTGTDGGMVLVSVVVTFSFVGLPLIALATAAAVLLLLPKVRRHFWQPTR